jgi:hypothetical protein
MLCLLLILIIGVLCLFLLPSVAQERIKTERVAYGMLTANEYPARVRTLDSFQRQTATN